MDLTALLHKTFGFPAFRANQESVCRAATEGRDVLLVMPTGAGKSLCYQLPAIARGGCALVISPLIALMDDQAAKLSALGLQVARIHSGLSRDEVRQACRDYLSGQLQFLFIAPERLRVPGFPEMLAKRKPALIAIDEAHCISQWGHDFRPDYRTLGDHLSSLRPAPVIALTATATPTVQRDIIAQLRLTDPALFIHGFRRHNLAIEVVELSKPKRNEFTVNLLKSPENLPAIVYAPSRKSAEELASLLGGRAAAYHAGLDPATRERVQRHFLSGKLEIVVATIAFGMGIDKPNVRTVIHTALPASVEAYYQEVGRAGRDGLPSRTVLLHSFADRKMHDFFLERDYPAPSELSRLAVVLTPEFQMPDALRKRLKMDVETFDRTAEKLVAQGGAALDIAGNLRTTGHTGWRSGYDAQLAFRREQIDRMVRFAETPQCRMAALIQHFGDTADGLRPCGHCDFCSPERATAQTFRAPTREEDRQLRAILNALQGAPPRATGKLHSDLALGIDRKQFDAYLEALTRAGLITLTTDTFTPQGETREITFKRAALSHEGRTLSDDAPLPIHLKDTASSVVTKSTRHNSKSSSPSRKTKPKTKQMQPAGAIASKHHKTASRDPKASALGLSTSKREGRALALGVTLPAETSARSRPTSAQTAAPLTPDQQLLDQRLRHWRSAEAERLGMPQFFVLGSSTLRSIVLIRPRTLAHLQTIGGLSQEKLERFGAAILEACNA